MSHFFSSIKTYAFAHKFITGFAVVAALSVSYWIYTANNPTVAQAKYVLGTVEKGTIVSSLTGSGQVSVVNQLDVKSKASGDAIYIGVANGAEVSAGTLLAEVDPTDALKLVRDAQAALDKEKLNLQRLQGGMINQTDVRGSQDKATADLNQSYESTFTDVAGAFTDLPNVLLGLQNIIFSTTLSGSDHWNMDYYADIASAYDPTTSNAAKANVYASYQAALAAYTANFNDYKTATLASDHATLDSLLAKTYSTVKAFAEAVKNTHALVQLYHDALTAKNVKPSSISEADLNNLTGYTSKISGDLSSLSNDAANVQAKKEASGNVGFDIADQQLQVTKAEDALTDAKTALANCYVRAPFDGVAAKISIKKGDSISSGTVVGTLITKQKTAQISLNEVDIVKIKTGQKATLKFDAIGGLSVTGHVTEADTLGTVSQGVVTYSVKIALDTDDARIRPGMSVSAAIITDVKTDVLMVQNSAVKSQGGTSYVETYTGQIPSGTANAQGVLLPTAPTRQPVVTGAANDTSTEIVSGLNEGDQIIVRTITATAAKTTTAQTSAFSIGGTGGARNGGFGGGAIRATTVGSRSGD